MMQLFWNLFGFMVMLWEYETMTLRMATWLIGGLIGLFLVLSLYVYIIENHRLGYTLLKDSGTENILH